MLRKCLLLVLTVSLFGCSHLVAKPPPADPETGPPTLLVKLMGTPRQIVVGPRAAGVCFNTPKCPDNFKVMWLGPASPGEKIRIKFTTLGADKCFDKVDFLITGVGAGNQVTVKVLNEPLCKKEFFPFMISCEGGVGGNCGGVGPVDPGAMIDG